VLDVVSGFMSMPRKMAGSEISTIDESIVAIRVPMVVLTSTVHL
jgi:hypothetical protein